MFQKQDLKYKDSNDMWKNLENQYGVKKGPYALFFKRIIDLVITLVGFCVISPVFLILCILVRINLGSPIFLSRSEREKMKKHLK